MTSKYKENDMEGDDGEEGDSEVVEDVNGAKEAEEEFSLEEVLHLGGTRVSFLILLLEMDQ